jgi:iron(III) transport system substrate-binding protein
MSVAAVGAGIAAPLEIAQSTAGASTSVPLFVYSSEGYDALEVRAFEKATGVTVRIRTDTTAALVDQIEASKKHPKWGLLWVDGSTVFATLDRQHLLVTGLKPAVSWNALGTSAIPKDRSYVPTGVTLADALVYTSKVVTNPPTAWQQLAEPQWKHKVGISDPSRTGSTFPFIAGMMYDLGGDNGVRKGERFFESLKKNGLVVHTTSYQTLGSVTSGEIEIAVVQNSAAIGYAAKRPTLRVAYLPPITALPSAIGIDAKAPAAEQAEAKQFVNFVLSQSGQAVMEAGTRLDDSLYYPVVHGIAPLKTLPPLTTIKMQAITPYVWGPREASINKWFDAKITR